MTILFHFPMAASSGTVTRTSAALGGMTMALGKWSVDLLVRLVLLGKRYVRGPVRVHFCASSRYGPLRCECRNIVGFSVRRNHSISLVTFAKE